MKRAPHQPVGELRLYAGIYLKTWSVTDSGTLLPQHAHRHAHISLIISGKVRVWKGGEMLGDYVAPATVCIAAETLHTFLTLTDDVVIACIHAIGEAEDVEIAEEHNLVLED